MTCRVQERYLCLLYFLSYFPLNFVHHKNRVRSITWKPLKLYSQNFIQISISMRFCFVWFDSLCPINNLSVKQGWVFLGEPVLSWDKCALLKVHNAVRPVRLKPAAPRSWVKHFTTEPLRSQLAWDDVLRAGMVTLPFILFELFSLELCPSQKPCQLYNLKTT